MPFQKGPYFCRATREERLGLLLSSEEVVVDTLVLFIICKDDGKEGKEDDKKILPRCLEKNRKRALAFYSLPFNMACVEETKTTW